MFAFLHIVFSHRPAGELLVSFALIMTETQY